MIIDDAGSLTSAIDPLQNEMMETEGVNTDNEKEEIEGADAENEGMESENEGVGNVSLPTEKK